MPINILDRQHLLGEHVELHVIFNAILRGKGGFSNHPQTNRFKNHIGMLIDRHRQQVVEMRKRGYNHKSPLIIHGETTPEKYCYTEQEAETDLKVLRERNGIIEGQY